MYGVVRLGGVHCWRVVRGQGRVRLGSVDEAAVRNQIGGTVVGAVVQAGTIDQVVLYQQPQADVALVPRQLPAVVRDFAGRDAELAALDKILSPDSVTVEPMVVAVDGTAGVGKTSLVVWWARRVEQRFPDGTLFVNLRGYGPSAPVEAGLVLASFLQALGVAEDRVPADLDGQGALYRSLLAGRRVLVVLDNAASAEQVRPLLPATAGCAVIVTSRAVLTGLVVVDSARRLPLDLFRPEEAVGLATRVIGPDRVAAEPAAVVELVRLCARLPLAVRVAASRVAARPHTAVADVVADLVDEHDGLDALSATGDDRSAVRTVFDWSYTRLSAEHARTFRRLGLHPGTEFGMHAVAALTGLDRKTASRHLEVLADLHLVEPVAHGRYRLHDLLHAYAAHRARLDDTSEQRRAAVDAVVSWYARTAVEADRRVFAAHPSPDLGLTGDAAPMELADRGQGLAWLTVEHATLDAVQQQAGAHGAYREVMAVALAMRFLVFRSRVLWPARMRAESRGIDAARACGDRQVEATLLLWRGDTLQQMGEWDASDTDLHAALTLAGELGDDALYGKALSGLGLGRVRQQRFADAEPYYRRALPLVRGLPSGYYEAIVHANLARITTRLGRHREALDHAERELALRRTAGVPDGVAFALHNVARARQGLGEDQAAIDLCRQALALYLAEAGNDLYVAATLETLATSLRQVGDHEGAVRCLIEAVTVLTDLGDPHADVLRGRLSQDGQPPADPHP
ncbi:putative ATPase [Saccharothrix carnea]|uniref:Putative ATPase n=1 Tax=Saccharothrix carnea TaxID=1280637 RepID=A0A2P8I4A5_SACCR|nr:putative ATPase [Saccharothrix carnea]